MSTTEKLAFFGGFIAVFGYPLPFLVIGEQWFLLTLYVLTNAAFVTTLKMFLCSQCINFACPLNSVEDAARDLFFQRNPSVGHAWGRAGQK
jgi:hypothetical protein